MKKIIIAALIVPSMALAQTFPSPTFNNITLQNPLTPSNGGTGVNNAGTITLGGNLTTSGSSPLTLTTTGSTNITLPTSGTLLNGTSGATAGANSNITSLTGLTTPLSASQGGTGVTGSTGSGLVVLSASPTLTSATLTTPSLSSPSMSGTPTAPSASVGTNTTQLATTAYVANHEGCKNILDYGGNNTATANNDTAYQSAISANSANNICVYFPPGTYNFASNAAYTFPSSPTNVVIQGAGQEATVLQWTGGGGMTFNYKIAANTVTIHDLTVATGTTNTGTGILLNQTSGSLAASAVNTIQNVTVRGADGFYGNDYFVTAVSLVGVSNVNLVGLTIAGTSGTVHGVGINIGASILGIVYNLTNVNVVGMNDGLVYGNNVQGVQITNANFTGNNVGILVPSGESNLSQLTVTGSQFSNAISDIDILSGIPGVQLLGNLFLVRNNANSVQLAVTSHTVISNNTFSPNQGSPSNLNGVALGGWAVGGTVITGNVFYSLTTAVTLTSTSKNVNVQSNVYVGNANSVLNSGTGNTIGGGTP